MTPATKNVIIVVVLIVVAIGILGMVFYFNSCKKSDSDTITMTKKDFQKYDSLNTANAELEKKNAKLEVIDSIKNDMINSLLTNANIVKGNIENIKTNLVKKLNDVHSLSNQDKENFALKLYGFTK